MFLGVEGGVLGGGLGREGRGVLGLGEMGWGIERLGGCRGCSTYGGNFLFEQSEFCIKVIVGSGHEDGGKKGMRQRRYLLYGGARRRVSTTRPKISRVEMTSGNLWTRVNGFI